MQAEVQAGPERTLERQGSGWQGGGGLHPWAQGGGQQLRVEADDAGVGSGGRPSGLKRGGGPQLDPGVGRAAPWGVADTLSSQADSDTKLLARLVPAKSLLP